MDHLHISVYGNSGTRLTEDCDTNLHYESHLQMRMDMLPAGPRVALRRRHNIVIAIGASIALALTVSVLGVESASAWTRSRLAVSINPDRSSAVLLDGSTAKGKIYVFVRNSRSIGKVDFYLDDPRRTKPPVRTDAIPPFDFAGTAADGTAAPYDTAMLTNGSHNITAVLTWLNGGTSSHRGNFTVANDGAAPPPTTAPTTAATAPSTPAATTTTAPVATTAPATTTTTTVPVATTAPPTTATTTAPATAGPAPSTTALPVTTGSWPSSPPAKVCGNASLLGGPATAPAGAIVVPAGNNNSLVPDWVANGFSTPNKTFWFAPGVHTLGTGEFDQIGPGNNSVFVGAPGAIIDGQHRNRYAFGGQGSNLTLKYLEIRNFGDVGDNNNEGVINHDPADNWTMEYLYAHHNAGAAIFMGSNNILRDSCLTLNGQYGFSMFKEMTSAESAIKNVTVDHNEISYNNTDDWEKRIPFCGCTGAGKFWDVQTADVTNNYIHNNKGVGVWADTDDIDFNISGNWIVDNDGEGVFYEISYNASITGNYLKGNGFDPGPQNLVPSGGIYLSSSGGYPEVPGRWKKIIVANNKFEDNWSGVSIFDAPERFCGSPNNTSTGYCTTPLDHRETGQCNPTNINTQPYYDACRWKTQNIEVYGNEFHLNKANIPNCAGHKSCGVNALISTCGTPNPSWSPYLNEAIARPQLYDYNVNFHNNKYFGPWDFMTFVAGWNHSFTTWQQGKPTNRNSIVACGSSSNYSSMTGAGQDAGSTYTP
jgi:Right handed beta helix region